MSDVNLKGSRTSKKRIMFDIAPSKKSFKKSIIWTLKLKEVLTTLQTDWHKRCRNKHCRIFWSHPFLQAARAIDTEKLDSQTTWQIYNSWWTTKAYAHVLNIKPGSFHSAANMNKTFAYLQGIRLLGVQNKLWVCIDSNSMVHNFWFTKRRRASRLQIVEERKWQVTG